MMDKHDIYTMSEIANRGLPIVNAQIPAGISKIKKLDLMMDIEYTHDESPLDFDQFLAFDDGDFGHDICGIYANFNRTTLKMDNFFSPRCTLRETTEEIVNGKMAALAYNLQALVSTARQRKLEDIDDAGLGRA